MKAKRMAIAGALLALAAGLAATAAIAAAGGSTSVKEGGTLRINISSTDIQSIDPAVDYEFYGWSIEFATCLKLLNYPDKPGVAGTVLHPEAAAGMPRVSADGKTYTFTIRPGLKFNTGEEVTAATYAEAFNRALNPKLQSPAVSFLHDVVGADATVAGKTKTAAGIRASGNTLTVRLTKAAPDFLARSAMNFFCAIPHGLPVPMTEKSIAGAGPYYIDSWTPNRTVIVKRNPNYNGPRPHHVDEMFFTVNTNINQSLLQVKAGEADYDSYGLPATAPSQLSKQYGVNKSRFFVHPQNGIQYIAINTRRVPDASVRKAMNYAIDRPAMVRQAGVFAGTPTDQILPPTMRGYRDAKLYPLQAPDLARAKALMNGRHLSLTLYSTNDPQSQNLDQVVVANLKAIGIDVKPKPLPFSTLVRAIGSPTEPYDLVLIGWFADYPDPVDFLNILFHGDNISEQNNVNLALFDNAAFNKRMSAAERLSGPARYETFGKIDVDLMRDQAPWMPLFVSNVREFISARVGCYIYQPAFAGMDYANVCLK